MPTKLHGTVEKIQIQVIGERNRPQEDCGDGDGFEHIQEILRDSDHPEHEETVVWLKTGNDPERFSCAEVNVLLQERATSLNPKQLQVQAPSKKPPRLTVAGLKKKLRNSSQQELVQLIAESFASGRQAQQFLPRRFDRNDRCICFRT